MKRTRVVPSPSTKKPARQRRSRVNLKQLEDRLALLVLLLQHNIDKVLHHKRTR